MDRSADQVDDIVRLFSRADDDFFSDCCQEVDRQRLSAVVNTTKADKFLDGERTAVVEDPSLVHYSCLTLPHLMAIVSRPMATSTATSVALVVIDSITALINSALPKPVTATKQKNTKGMTDCHSVC